MLRASGQSAGCSPAYDFADLYPGTEIRKCEKSDRKFTDQFIGVTGWSWGGKRANGRALARNLFLELIR
jgi:dienelactone hydrolase